MSMDNAPLFEDIAAGPAGGRAFWRVCQDGTRIRVGYWPANPDMSCKGTVLLFPGRTEYIEKYGLTSAELSVMGFHVLTIDWRGQGLSDRPKDAPMLGHVDDFLEFQLDVNELVAVKTELDLPKPCVLLAHSMGGCIGLRALHQGLDVVGACFSAPMWGIQMSSAMRPIAWAMSWAAHQANLNLLRTPGTTEETYVSQQPFYDNTLTTDPDMYALMQKQVAAHPELSLGGPTAGWLYTALREMSALVALQPPDLPAVAFLGTNERIVGAGQIRSVMSRWVDGELRIMQGCEHEVLMESPEVRSSIYTALEDLVLGRPRPTPRLSA